MYQIFLQWLDVAVQIGAEACSFGSPSKEGRAKVDFPQSVSLTFAVQTSMNPRHNAARSRLLEVPNASSSFSIIDRYQSLLCHFSKQATFFPKVVEQVADKYSISLSLSSFFRNASVWLNRSCHMICIRRIVRCLVLQCNASAVLTDI